MAKSNIFLIAASALCLFLRFNSSFAWAVSAHAGNPHLLWSVNFSALGCPNPRFDSEFYATRQAVFATEDRVVVVYAARPSPSQGPAMGDQVCMLSFSAGDGALIASRKESVSVYSDRPLIFPTARGEVIAVPSGVVLLPIAFLLHSDLSETGVAFRIPDHCQIQHASPDGTAVGLEGNGLTRLLDTNMLRPTGVSLDDAVPTAISSKSSATNLTSWPHNKPPRRFGSITTQSGSAPLVLSRCHKGFQVDYLSDEVLLITCTDSFQVQDAQGRVWMDQRDRGKRVSFGGVSRNGKRFVVDVSGRSRFDPWPVTSEKLQVFDVDQKKPIAALEVDPPAQGSWSALSPKGDLLLTASGDSLRVYRIP